MKIVEKKILHSTEGNSDKIYEAEICEISDGKYLVNFRYGRRGANLKEGTKTDSPVDFNLAQKLFKDLVLSKTKKGYSEVNELPDTEVKKVERLVAPKSEDNDPVKNLILERLAKKQSILSSLIDKVSGKTKKVHLKRVIWRVGELRLKEATPLLLKHLDGGDELQKYCCISSLGLCGNQDVLPVLYKIYEGNQSETLKRISFEAILKLESEDKIQELINKEVDLLPLELKESLLNDSLTIFQNKFNKYLNTSKQYSLLENLYKINNEKTRSILLDILKTLDLKPKKFKYIRHIYKMAEYRYDAEVFGLLAYRIEKEKATYNNTGYYYGFYDNASGRYFYERDIKKELKSPDSKFAYLQKTKTYLQLRTNRYLRKLAEIDDFEYLKAAVSVLLKYSDLDADTSELVKKDDFYSYQNGRYIKVSKVRYFHPFSKKFLLNEIIYKNSDRYFKSKGMPIYQSKGENLTSDKREEAYPEIWNKYPQGLVHLLAESKCKDVHDFATKAFRENIDVWNKIDNETLMMIVEKDYESSSLLALDIFKHNIENGFDTGILYRLSDSKYESIRKQALKLIKENISKIKEINLRSMLYLLLLTSKYQENRILAQDLFNLESLEQEHKDNFIRLFSNYFIKNSHNLSLDIAKFSILFLEKYFTNELKNIDLEIVSKLINTKFEPSIFLGGKLLLNHNSDISEFPYESIMYLVESIYQSVREIGFELFGRLPEKLLLSRTDMIISFCLTKVSEIRKLVKPIISKLSNSNKGFGENLILELVPYLMKKELYEGLHQDLLSLFKNELLQRINIIDYELCLKLIKSRYEHSQDLGGFVLGLEFNKDWSDKFDLVEIVKLSNHDILSIREYSWSVITLKFDNIRKNKSDLLKVMRLFDSKKDDSRYYATNTLSKLFTSEDWTPDLLISLCDSIYQDIRAFARNNILNYFKSVQGEEYLIKLSEHPSTDMQFFATSYLEGYASNKPEKIELLIPYFKRVLSQVNKSRTAKNRIINFLLSEALKNKETAIISNNIFSWYSLTNSIEDKAKVIDALVQIKNKYSDIDSIILIKDVEVKYGV